MHLRALKALLFFTMFVLLVSCETQTVYSDYQQLDNGVWKVEDTIQFSFSELDSLEKYDMFLNVRNDNDFAFSNLFLITELNYPGGETVSDTLEYEMALPDGSWLGKGFGSIKESKLWYRENIVFPDSGVYNLKISHAMRKNGNVEGISNLQGITDIGVEITKRIK
ncbi:gliding motility lipoprotein GldH [Croceitalea sp. MTPC9]|uniref:gliding motility lipoprotein GldH n=1 Tax=unclassified Croceitalea TaxID=2632280 RepID=UPI002B3F4592|nr:gliding motility lipoprotein GldH [Croceitalea sp. MTPC6]GMN16524.1 gliding motility lipoprotein GldH [Croceitalea sp. MTPC9]